MEMEVHGQSEKNVDFDGSITYRTGLHFDLDDDKNYAYQKGVRTIVVTGPCLPAMGITFNSNRPAYSGFTYQAAEDDFYPIADDDALAAVQDNAGYRLDCYDGTKNLIYTRKVTILRRPALNSELTTLNLFPVLIDPATHDIAGLDIGAIGTVRWTLPGFDIMNTHVKLELQTLNEIYTFEDGADGRMGSCTFDLTGISPLAVIGAPLSIHVEDAYDREFQLNWDYGDILQ